MSSEGTKHAPTPRSASAMSVSEFFDTTRTSGEMPASASLRREYSPGTSFAHEKEWACSKPLNRAGGLALLGNAIRLLAVEVLEE